MARNGTTFVKGQVTNPKGRPPKTDVERAAEDFLRSRNLHAAQRLVASADGAYDDGDFKTAGGLYAAHLKFTLGEHVRTETKDVTERRLNYPGLTLGELRALARGEPLLVAAGPVEPNGEPRSGSTEQGPALKP